MPYYVLYLRPVGNAVVPLSDEHPLGALNGRPYTCPREICQCLYLFNRIAERDERERRDVRERRDPKFEVRSSGFEVPKTSNFGPRTSNPPPSRW
jgi:hypothetical protein